MKITKCKIPYENCMLGGLSKGTVKLFCWSSVYNLYFYIDSVITM